MQITVSAEHLRMVLVAKHAARSNPTLTSCWAAMAPFRWTPASCNRRNCTPALLQMPGGLQPMNRGQLRTLVERTRYSRGLDEIRRTWGTGLRALRAELATSTLRQPTAQGAA